jgi:hypothetical protein
MASLPVSLSTIVRLNETEYGLVIPEFFQASTTHARNATTILTQGVGMKCYPQLRKGIFTLLRGLDRQVNRRHTYQ